MFSSATNALEATLGTSAEGEPPSSAPLVLIDGPNFPGEWSNVAADALTRLGFQTVVLHDTTKRHPLIRWVKRVNKAVPLSRRILDWESFWIHHLHQQIRLRRPAVFLSIQGKLNSHACSEFKRAHSDVKLIYWIGGLIKGNASLTRRIRDLAPASASGALDCILVSCRSSVRIAESVGAKNVRLFPFGYSPGLHHLPGDDSISRVPSHSVVFVASADPQRALFVRRLTEALGQPIALYGQWWERYGLKSLGFLSLKDSLAIYRAAKISINHFRGDPDDGYNMRFIEIPAAGGFQILNFNRFVEQTPLRRTPMYKTVEECAHLIRYYLQHDEEREQLRKQLSSIARTECSYTVSFCEVFVQLGLTTRQSSWPTG